MRPQVQVNKQAVALPYRKYGLQVYESGINFVVDIPRLGAIISYNGLAFSIRLPYRLFGNNTKGQCGESPARLGLPAGRGGQGLGGSPAPPLPGDLRLRDLGPCAGRGRLAPPRAAALAPSSARRPGSGRGDAGAGGAAWAGGARAEG